MRLALRKAFALLCSSLIWPAKILYCCLERIRVSEFLHPLPLQPLDLEVEFGLDGVEVGCYPRVERPQDACYQLAHFPVASLLQACPPHRYHSPAVWS